VRLLKEVLPKPHLNSEVECSLSFYIFCTFRYIWIHFNTGDAHSLLLSVCDFHENCGSESHIIREILPVILFSGLSEIRYFVCTLHCSGNFMFGENRYVESCTFFVGVNKSVYKRALSLRMGLTFWK